MKVRFKARNIVKNCETSKAYAIRYSNLVFIPKRVAMLVPIADTATGHTFNVKYNHYDVIVPNKWLTDNPEVLNELELCYNANKMYYDNITDVSYERE